MKVRIPRDLRRALEDIDGEGALTGVVAVWLTDPPQDGLGFIECVAEDERARILMLLREAVNRLEAYG